MIHTHFKQSELATGVLAVFAAWGVPASHAQHLNIDSGTTSLASQAIGQLTIREDGTIVDATGITVDGQVFVATGASLDINESVVCASAQCDIGLRVQGLGVQPGETGERTHVSGNGLEIYANNVGISQTFSSLIDLTDVHINASIGLDLNGSVRKNDEPIVTQISDFDIVAGKHGVYAIHGAEVRLADGAILTVEDAGHGVYLGGATSGATPIQTVAFMDRVSVLTSGDHAYGLRSVQMGGANYPSRGAISYWSDSSLTTLGTGSHGVVADYSWNTVRLANGSVINTSGQGAHAIWAKGGAEVVLDGSRATTTGAGSVGVISQLLAMTRLSNGALVATTGTGSHGAMVQQAGRIEVANSTISAQGADAHGIYMLAGSYANAGQQSSEVRLSGSRVEARHGYGVAAQGGRLMISVLDGSVLMGGAGLMDVQEYPDPLNRETIVDMRVDSNSTVIGRVQTAGSAVSNVVLQGGSTWQVDGDSDVTTLANRHATVQFVPAAAGPGGFNTLRVSGNYVGDGGTIVFNTALAGDNSPTDRLMVGGDVSGHTYVKVLNRGGLGAATQDGIRIIGVAGQSPADAFTLQHDYVAALGRPAIVAGAYGYSLYQGSAADPHDGNWYLRSEYMADGAGSGPMYQPGAPLYESYAHVLHELNGLPSLRERVGERQFAAAPESGGGIWQDGLGIWGRVQGSHGRFQPGRSTTGVRQDVDIWRMQIGADMQVYEGERGHLVAGLSAHYGDAGSQVESAFGKGKIQARGYGLGGTLTWYGRNGFYVDAQLQANRFDSDLISRTLGVKEVAGNDGFGYALGLEAGRRVGLSDRWAVTPQAQLAYSHVTYDDFRDAYQTTVSLQGRHRVVGRLGISADYRLLQPNGDTFDAYGIVNLYQIFSDQSRVDVAGVPLVQRNAHTWAGLGAGVSYSWGRGAYMLYGSADVRTSLQALGDSHGAAATLGARIRF